MSEIPVLPHPSELPEEFHQATELDRFHRYAMAADESDTRLYFGLVGKDGSHKYYWANLGTIMGLTRIFEGMTGQLNDIAEKSGKPPKVMPFQTYRIFFEKHIEAGKLLSLIFNFQTIGGPILATEIGPRLSAEIAANVLEALRTLPILPPLPEASLSNANIPGEQHRGDTVAYFGQFFDPQILQVLGVLLVRANLLDSDLVALFSALSGMTQERAAAAYYSTQNFKARTDLIRALIPLASLDEKVAAEICACLDDANSVAGRRNDLVHAVWRFDKNRFNAENYRPNAKNKRIKLTVNAQFILEIATAYREAGVSLALSTRRVLDHMANIARKTSSAPSAGSPSS